MGKEGKGLGENKGNKNKEIINKEICRLVLEELENGFEQGNQSTFVILVFLFLFFYLISVWGLIFLEVFFYRL